MSNEQLLAQIAALGGTDIAILLILSALLILPVFLVAMSKRAHGAKKIFWVVMVGTFSWLAYPPFLLMTRKSDSAANEPPGAA